MEQPEQHINPEPQEKPSRKRLITSLKLLVTAAGLYLVLSKFDARAIWSIIGNLQPGWMLFGAALVAASLPLRAYRWHIVLHGVGSRIRFGRLVELYLVGSFFNAFLPSGLGGDVVRAAEAAQDVDSGVAVGTVLVDRLSGLMAMFLMALAALPFRPTGFPSDVAAAIALVCLAGLAAGIVLADGRLFYFLMHLLPGKIRAAGNGFLDRLAQSVRRCSWRALMGALLVSVVFNMLQVGWWMATGLALGFDIPLIYYFIIVPILAMALLIPSVGGLGVRENLAPLLFSGAGIAPEQAVALTLLVFGLERVASLLGAPIYLVSILRNPRRRPDPDNTERR